MDGQYDGGCLFLLVLMNLVTDAGIRVPFAPVVFSKLLYVTLEIFFRETT